MGLLPFSQRGGGWWPCGVGKDEGLRCCHSSLSAFSNGRSDISCCLTSKLRVTATEMGVADSRQQGANGVGHLQMRQGESVVWEAGSAPCCNYEEMVGCLAALNDELAAHPDDIHDGRDIRPWRLGKE